MKRMVSLLCAAALFCLVFYGTAASAVTGSNLLPADASEMHPSNAYWFPFGGELEYRQVGGKLYFSLSNASRQELVFAGC